MLPVRLYPHSSQVGAVEIGHVGRSKTWIIGKTIQTTGSRIQSIGTIQGESECRKTITQIIAAAVATNMSQGFLALFRIACILERPTRITGAV